MLKANETTEMCEVVPTHLEPVSGLWPKTLSEKKTCSPVSTLCNKRHTHSEASAYIVTAILAPK